MERAAKYNSQADLLLKDQLLYLHTGFHLEKSQRELSSQQVCCPIKNGMDVIKVLKN